MHLFLDLEAIDPAKNIARHYSVDVATDLFGHVTVDLTYGRIGAWGRSLRVSSTSEEGALAIVRRTLLRRATGGRRFGAHYRTVRSHVPEHLASSLPVLP